MPLMVPQALEKKNPRASDQPRAQRAETEYFIVSLSFSTQEFDFGRRRHLAWMPLSAFVMTPQFVVVLVQYFTATGVMSKGFSTLISAKLPGSGARVESRMPPQTPHCSVGWTIFLASTPSMMPSWPGIFLSKEMTVMSAIRLGASGV